MDNYNDLLLQIIENNNKTDNKKINSILILYDRNAFYIGDTCIQLSRLKKIKSHYTNALIDINTLDSNHYKSINIIIENNPYVNNYYNLKWDEIDFNKYDLIMCASIPEKKFVDFLFTKYADLITNKQFNSAVFTASETVGFDEQVDDTRFFPLNEDFIRFQLPESEEKSMLANELFMRDEERNWANDWLANSGLLSDEKLLIFIDSSSTREKLLHLPVYFDILNEFAKKPKTKILIFDEKKIGKKMFYTEWLDSEVSKKIIYAEGLSLREAICLISSSYTKFIFGPSTGLLHCASGIFNILFQKKSVSDVPIMIAYLGKDKLNSYQEHFWWGGSLVNAILPIKESANNIGIKSIQEIDFMKYKLEDKIMECKDYSYEMITNYIKPKYEG